MKKKIVLICGILVIFSISFIFYVKSIHPQNNLVRIGYNVESLNHGPVIVAYEKGIFKNHDLKIELVPLKSGKEIQQALAIGRIDLGSAGATNFFPAISKGAPVKIIAFSTVSPTQIYVRPNEIETLASLQGKTVASRLGESSNLALGYALQKEDINLSGINFVDVDKSVRAVALMDKKIIDAAVAGEYENEIYSNYGAVLLKEWKTKGYAHKLFPRTVIAVNSNFMAKNKELVSLFIDSFIESQQFMKANPDEAALVISKHIEDQSDGAIQFSTQNIKDSWRELKYILWNDPSEIVEISVIEKEIGDIESSLNLDQIFDFSFETQLESAQKQLYGSVD